jgi:hypothetical protein
MKNLILLLSLSFLTINLFSQCENDSINPYFINFEPEVTISCDVDLSVVFPVALDECDDSVEIAWYEEVTTGICENNYDVFRVYRAFDNFGNQSVESQIIHVVDETSPLFVPLVNRTVECGDSIIFDDPQVTDNCSDFVLTYYNIIQNVDSCSTIYTRVWEAVDFCGNTSISSQTITSIDMTPPVITGPIYLEVNEDDNIDTSFVTVTDNCSSINLIYSDLEYSANNIIRNYTATDACGNVSTFEQIIGINIVIPPGDDDDDEDEDDEDEDDEDEDEDEDDEDEDEDEDDEDEDEDDEDDDDCHKVAICHGTGNGSYHTIYVNQNAVQAHLNHGDYLGPCTEMIIDWQTILPNSDLQMRVIKGKDNKYKKFVRVR